MTSVEEVKGHRDFRPIRVPEGWISFGRISPGETGSRRLVKSFPRGFRFGVTVTSLPGTGTRTVYGSVAQVNSNRPARGLIPRTTHDPRRGGSRSPKFSADQGPSTMIKFGRFSPGKSGSRRRLKIFGRSFFLGVTVTSSLGAATGTEFGSVT